MRKKLLSLALALVMCLSLMPSAFAAERASEFTDVPEGAWYAEELDYAVYNGYISGTSDTTFSPESTITRGQFVTIMGRMLDAPTDSGKTAFEDVPENAFYAPYVAWASSKGYVNGFSVKEFGPNNNISVEQMAAILDNYIRKEDAVLTEANVIYHDYDKVSAWAVSSIETMEKYNLLRMDEYGNVNPQKQVTRAEAAVSLVRLAKGLNLGVVPPTGQTDLSAERAEAQRIHDELWSTGKLNSSMTEKEKAIAYFEWMAIHCRYSNSSDNTFRHTAYGALVERVAVCDGLSSGYKMLLETEGIKCECVINSRATHMSNEVFLDGEWYFVDMACVNFTKNPDGSHDPFAFSIYVRKYFDSAIDDPTYPDA